MSSDLEEASERQPLLLKKNGGGDCQSITTTTFRPAAAAAAKRGGWFARRRRRKEMEQRNRLVALYAEDEANLKGGREGCQLHIDKCDELEERRRKIDKRLATATFILNFSLLIGNLTAAFLSGSYAVISAFIDSAMDMLSSITVFSTVWAINHTDMIRYPRGRERLEVVAVICTSVIMATANIVMIGQSIGAILTDSVNPDANLPTLAILIGGILLKLVFVVICYKHGTVNSRVLALDQRNDIITSVVAVVCATVGDYYWLYADPLGAILVCSFVAFSWFSNAFNNIPLIVGHRVEQEHYSRILRIAMNHDERIKYLDHLMVYHTGEKAIVELHIVLDEHLPLKVTHDIAEALSEKLSALDFVERVFIHVDFKCDGHIDGK